MRRLDIGVASYGNPVRLEKTLRGIASHSVTDYRIFVVHNPGGAGDLMSLLTQIRADGITLLLIEHDMRLVMGLCDRVAVLDYGKKIVEGVPRAVQSDPRVIEAYVGSETP